MSNVINAILALLAMSAISVHWMSTGTGTIQTIWAMLDPLFV